jgi:thiol-disulfide isomerase/thioredoxin
MPRQRAPELAPALAWLNASRPLSMAELQGCVVLLHFWTASSVSCQHVIALLQMLAARYAARPLALVGVHSAQFAVEAFPERVALAVAEQAIRYPVVVDDDLQIASRYGVRVWPSLVVVGSDGSIALVAPGEPNEQVLEQFIVSELALAERQGPRRGASGLGEPVTEQASSSALRFPTKVAVAGNGRLAVADSGRHRVLICAANGEIEEVVGGAAPGHRDGPFADAAFQQPRGLAWDGELVWLCDAGSHTIRRIDLVSRLVTTVAGTACLASAPLRGERPAVEVALRSPFDLVVADTHLVVALAGSHQLAAYDKQKHTLALLAGTGREALVDGGLLAACFAQPAALWRDGPVLYVADSASSALRRVDLQTAEVETLVGPSFFDASAPESARRQAQLQRPLGVALLGPDDLVVADTYNDCVRRLHLADGRLSLLSCGGHGRQALRAPASAVPVPGGGLLVCDTANHRLVRLSPGGAFLGELVPHAKADLPKPRPPELVLRHEGAPLATLTRTPPHNGASLLLVRWQQAKVSNGGRVGTGQLRLRLALRAPGRQAIVPGLQARLAVGQRQDLITLTSEVLVSDKGGNLVNLETDVSVRPMSSEHIPGELLIVVEAQLCHDGACLPVRSFYRIPLTIVSAGAHELEVELPLRLPA